MSIAVTDLRPGVTIDLDKAIYTVVEYNHIKMGRGGAIIRVKLKNIENGNTIERTFKSGDKVPKALVERKQMQYLYNQSGDYHFMDQATFEQLALDKVAMAGADNYIKDGDVIQMLTHNDRVIGVDLPTSVALKITETGANFKGDSVSNVMKPATLETGFETLVPMFVKVNELVLIDTRTGKYIERA